MEPLDPFEAAEAAGATPDPFAEAEATSTSADPFAIAESSYQPPISNTTGDGGVLKGQNFTPEEISQLAAKYKVSPDDLSRLAPYYGVGVEGRDGFLDSARRGVGIASEALAGLPTFAAKKAVTAATGNTNLEDAMDELNALAQQKKSYLQAGTELIGGALLPVGNIAKGGVLATAAKSAPVGAAMALGESKRGEELEDVALGAGFGAALGAAIPAIGKGYNRLSTALDIGPSKVTNATNKFEELDKLYAPYKDADVQMANKLFTKDIGKEALLEPALNKDLVGFAKSLVGQDVPPTKAIDVIDDFKAKLSPEDFSARFIDYRKNGIAAEFLSNTLGPENAGVSAIRNTLRTFQDASYAVRNIDRRLGSDLSTMLLNGTRQINRYQNDLAETLLSVRPIYGKLNDRNSEVIFDAINKGGISKLRLDDREVAKSIVSFYDGIKKKLNDLGVPVQELASKADDGGYVPNRLIDMPKAVSAIRGKIEEAGGMDKALSLVMSENVPEGLKPMADDLKKTVAYFQRGMDRPAKEILAELVEPGTAVWKKEKLATALYQREEVIPEYLMDKDVRNLTTKYLMESLRYAHVKEVLQDLSAQKDKLSILGAKADAEYVDNLVSDYIDVGRKDGDTIAQRGRAVVSSLQVMMYDAARKAKDPLVKSTYEWFADSPDGLKKLFMNVYPNFLGLSPRAAIQNVVGGLYTSIPELGYIYGTKSAAKAVANASKNLSLNNKAYLRELEDKGLVAAQWTTDLQDTFRKGGSSKLQKVADKTSQWAMALFEASEKYNRAIMYETGKILAKDYLEGAPEALRFIKTMPPAMQKRLAAASPQDKQDLIVRYLGDRILFSYNKLNQAEFARGLGPLFSMFTKYPFAILSRMTDNVRQGNMAYAGADLIKFAIAPYLAGSMLTNFINPDEASPTEEFLFGKRGPGSLGHGLASSSPVGAVEGVIEGRVFKGPAVSTVSTLGKAVLSGDEDALAKWIIDSFLAFSPGGIGAAVKVYKNVTEE